jgi:hypothetical protein
MVFCHVLSEILIYALKLAAIFKNCLHIIYLYISYMNILLNAFSELYSLKTLYIDTNIIFFGHVLFEILNNALKLAAIFQNGRHIIYWHELTLKHSHKFNFWTLHPIKPIYRHQYYEFWSCTFRDKIML